MYVYVYLYTHRSFIALHAVTMSSNILCNNIVILCNNSDIM